MAQPTIAENMIPPVLADYDVVVAGGGASGLVAAVAAERSGCLGGTANLRHGRAVDRAVQWHRALRRRHRLRAHRTRAGHGCSDGFRRYTLAEASANPVTITNFPFNPEVVKIAADEIAREAGVDVLLHTRVVRPLVDGQRVQGLVLENVSGRGALRSAMLVDATGDAVLAAAAGVPCVGEEPQLCATNASRARWRSACRTWTCAPFARCPASRSVRLPWPA